MKGTEHCCFDRFLAVLIIERDMPDDGIELFGGDGFRECLFVFALAPMWDLIGDVEHRVACFVAKAHIHCCAVGGIDKPVECQWHAGPLVFLDAAVVVGL